LILAAGSIQRAQQRQRQAVDSNGAPLFKVDPFWPKPLPNRWGMQQVTGIFVDQNDHIWFLNRAAKADPDEVGGENNRIDCCIRGPELIELRSEEHTSELQSRGHLVCRLLLEKKKKTYKMLAFDQLSAKDF